MQKFIVTSVLEGGVPFTSLHDTYDQAYEAATYKSESDNGAFVNIEIQSDGVPKELIGRFTNNDTLYNNVPCGAFKITITTDGRKDFNTVTYIRFHRFN